MKEHNTENGHIIIFDNFDEYYNYLNKLKANKKSKTKAKKAHRKGEKAAKNNVSLRASDNNLKKTEATNTINYKHLYEKAYDEVKALHDVIEKDTVILANKDKEIFRLNNIIKDYKGTINTLKDIINKL